MQRQMRGAARVRALSHQSARAAAARRRREAAAARAEHHRAGPAADAALVLLLMVVVVVLVGAAAFRLRRGARGDEPRGERGTATAAIADPRRRARVLLGFGAVRRGDSRATARTGVVQEPRGGEGPRCGRARSWIQQTGREARARAGRERSRRSHEERAWVGRIEGA